MTSVLPLLLAVLVQALGEADLGSGWEAPWAVPVFAGLPYLLAWRVRALAMRGAFHAAERWARPLRASGALAFAGAVLGCGWVASVERWTGARFDAFAWPEPAILLSLAPFVGFQVLALDAEVRSHTRPGVAQRSKFAFQVRGFLLVLAPVLVYLGAAWLVAAHPVARAWLENVGLAQSLFAVLALALVALLLPFLLRHVWDTVPVPEGPARRLLELVGARARFRPSEWLVWRTGGSMANAAVVGFVPWGRLVLFTDELLAILGPRELVAVVGHEIGHARRRHVWILMSWALAIVLGVDLALVHVVPVFDPLDGATLVGAMLGVSAALLGLGALWFGWLSRRLELDADLYCAELTGDSAALASALRQVDGNWERGGWRHLSSARRVAFLAEALAYPQRALRFKRRVAAMGALGAGLALAAIGVETRDLVQRLPLDRVGAALALGRFERASELAARVAPEALNEPEEVELRLVLETARGFDEGASARVLGAALEAQLGVLAAEGPALSSADNAADGSASRERDPALDRAFALAALAAQRGERDLGPVTDALRSARRGDADAAERALRSVDPRLRTQYGDAILRAAGNGQ
ncbi:MAG: M48 family metallopeptidase [Planctomycetota bacterium]